jgi:hypothetical protein
MKVRAIYPIFPPTRFDSETFVQNYNQLIEYISTPKEIAVRGETSVDGDKLLVELKEFSQSHKKHLTRTGAWKNYWVIEFSGSFTFPGVKKFNLKDHAGKIVPTPARELRTIWADFLPDELDLTIQTYMLALTIAFPGAMRPSDNVWWVGGGKQAHVKFYKSSVQQGSDFLYKEGYRSRDDIRAEDVIEWVFKSNGIFNGYSDTPGSRSLNLFSRLFAEDFYEDELSELVWAVAGIEALLVEGGRSSVGQLREKLSAIFRDRVDQAWLNKWITDVYNYRSRMVHGDRQVKSAFRSKDDDTASRFYEEYHSILFAVGILVELLREAIYQKLAKFSFTTVLKA